VEPTVFDTLKTINSMSGLMINVEGETGLLAQSVLVICMTMALHIEHRVVNFARTWAKDVSHFMVEHTARELVELIGNDWVSLPGSEAVDNDAVPYDPLNPRKETSRFEPSREGFTTMNPVPVVSRLCSDHLKSVYLAPVLLGKAHWRNGVERAGQRLGRQVHCASDSEPATKIKAINRHKKSPSHKSVILAKVRLSNSLIHSA
jgi:hypothetical protein